MQKKILVYGANGFTANLIIERIKHLDAQIILAGRNAKKISIVGKKFILPTESFSLSSPKIIEKHLEKIDLLINCAGPFTKTAKPLAKACLKTKTHYMDITGEIKVFQILNKLNQDAQKKNVALLPGLGFDIVPSDCLAAFLAKKINNPSALKIAIYTKGTRVSKGTFKTALSAFKSRTLARTKKGITKINRDKPAHKFDFGTKKVTCIRAPLADIYCAHLSTGIENIDTFLAVSKVAIPYFKLMPFVARFLQLPIVNSLFNRALEHTDLGPTIDQQKSGSAEIFCEVTNAEKEITRAVLHTKEPYAYTADLIFDACKIFLQSGLPAGFNTPSLAFGDQFATKSDPKKNYVTMLT